MVRPPPKAAKITAKEIPATAAEDNPVEPFCFLGVTEGEAAEVEVGREEADAVAVAVAVAVEVGLTGGAGTKSAFCTAVKAFSRAHSAPPAEVTARIVP